MWNNDSNQIKCIYEKENIKGLKTQKEKEKNLENQSELGNMDDLKTTISPAVIF